MQKFERIEKSGMVYTFRFLLEGPFRGFLKVPRMPEGAAKPRSSDSNTKKTILLLYHRLAKSFSLGSLMPHDCFKAGRPYPTPS
ncbi:MULTISPECIES: hypothetical protein [unclassified Neisseria]|uniref:hypothetical protein n=1 Tax=unclassified Neisseria TaxID=2623750 RepID=UPI00107238B2|nr:MULTISPECIES: hypothetical protein [unclassified Neisseria]MBF0803396.1 hypothetical protein [Neisseria sp. 19428wB4_WF04]TFU43906.1 hypothetical protein E4T99_03340 [Neisseria sp. WF04]